ncbi:hypothetical protein Trydic_g15308 [Trypoxylus dichotomus]
MFFEITLLCPQYKGKFATIWIAATRGVDKLAKKQILDVNIIDICHDITSMYVTQSHKPKERLSLSMTAKLVNGTIRIFRKQVVLLQESVFQCFTIPSTIFLKPQRTASTKRKVHKSRTVHSNEIVCSEEIVSQVEQVQSTEAAVELNITDKDVERALLEQPTTHADFITLREEVPTHLTTRDEENLFGDEGFIETQHFLFERGPPVTEADRIEFEQKISRDISRVGSQVEVDQVHIPSAEQEPAERVNIEKAAENEAEQQAQEKLGPIEPPKKKRRLEKNVEILEIPEKEIEQKDVQEPLRSRAEAILEEPVTPKKKINLETVTVKLNSKFRKIKLRCDDEYSEIFVKEVYSAVYSATNPEKFAAILDECQDMLIRSSQEILLEAVREQESSTMSGAGSRSRLTRMSQSTPTIARPGSKIILTEVVSGKEVDDRSPVTRERKELSGKKSPTPEVEVPTIIAVPTSLTLTATAIQEKETIIEDLPPAANVAQEPIISVVTDVITKTALEKKDVHVRQRKIVCLVRDWDFSACDLTIEDVAEKPLSRVHLAVAFSDLLNLHKLQYVKLTKKENSVELKKIEKGARLL